MKRFTEFFDVAHNVLDARGAFFISRNLEDISNGPTEFGVMTVPNQHASAIPHALGVAV